MIFRKLIYNNYKFMKFFIDKLTHNIDANLNVF